MKKYGRAELHLHAFLISAPVGS